MSPAQLQKAEEITGDLLKQGVISESSSNFNAPIVMVAKKTGETRMCLDLRALNAITTPSKFPLPTAREMFDNLAEAYYFTSLDMLWAYWSVPLREGDKSKTAFTVRNRKYAFNVMCFGLTNAPATFSHLVNKVFQGCQYKFSLCFLDDVLCYSPRNFTLHLYHLSQIFKRMRAAKLKFKLPKCIFGAAQIPFLGHLASREGLKPDPKKIEAVRKLRRPESKKQVRQLLGLASYYRQFVPNFASIAAPLYKLTNDKPKGVLWDDDCEWAFQEIKGSLTTAPVLMYPRWDKPFIVE
ncbi:unnamed protein product, partial [Heterosigma akashiwo]